MPGIPEMGEVWGPANAALELSLTGKQAPQAALDNAETDQDADRSHAGQQSVIPVKSQNGRGTSRFQKESCVIINPSENFAERAAQGAMRGAACCWLSCRVLASFIIASG
jgi:hypothetical protein